MLDKAKPRRHTRSSPFRGDDRDPLPIQFFAIGNGSAQTLRKVFGQQVTMVAEEFLLGTLPRAPILEERMRRLVFGGEDQSHVEAVASPGSHVDLRGGEVLDPYYVERLSSVAEPGPCEFVRRGPCGENARARISHRHKAAGFRMHHDVVAIGEIVFERESIWRIAEQARDK